MEALRREALAVQTYVTHRNLPIYTYGEDLEAEELCRIGSAVVTSTAGCGRLADTGYDAIAHTPPPMYPKEKHFDVTADFQNMQDLWNTCLANSYRRSISSLVYWQNAQKSKTFSDQFKPINLAIATPILGSGGRGAPLEQAVRAMVEGLVMAGKEQEKCDRNITVLVCVRYSEHFKIVSDVFNATETDA